MEEGQKSGLDETVGLGLAGLPVGLGICHLCRENQKPPGEPGLLEEQNMGTGSVITLSKSALLHAVVRLPLCGIKVRGRDRCEWGVQRTGSEHSTLCKNPRRNGRPRTPHFNEPADLEAIALHPQLEECSPVEPLEKLALKDRTYSCHAASVPGFQGI